MGKNTERQIERALDQELTELRARRLASESLMSELAYVPVTLAAAALVWPWVSGLQVVACVIASLAAVGMRTVLRQRAIRRGAAPKHVFTAVRIGVFLLSAVWAVAINVIGPQLPPVTVAWMAVIFAGLVAAGTTSLQPDPRSFYILATVLLGGLTTSVFANDGSPRVLALSIIVTYGVAMVVFYRRAHTGLLQQLRDAKRLELSERAARDARHDSERLERIVEVTADHVLMATADGRLTYLNPAGRAMLGIAADEDITGLTLFDITVPARHDEIRAHRLPALMAGGLWTGEGWLRHRDGHDIPVNIVAQTHRDEAGNVESISAIARDSTEQLAARHTLQEAHDAAKQANSAKSAFLANTSHEIRTPLNGILGMVELLQDTELTAEQRRNVDLIAASGETLLHTINDVLDISKIEASQLELETAPLQLPQLVYSVARLFAARTAERGVELIADVAPQVPAHVLGDAHRLRQVLSNLVGNAVKFTSRGEIVVAASVVSSGPRHEVRFSVRDSGIGIPQNQLERIFQPFSQVDASTTRHYGGTGLGLSIARRLVSLMGGELTVASQEGKGTEFHFVLPLGVVEGNPAADGVTELPRDARVLVVDDHPINRAIAEKAFVTAGVTVHSVASVADALDALHRSAGTHMAYDLVVTDVQMPDRDGFDLVSAIRGDARLTGVAIIMLSSGSRSGDGARARQLGARAYLEKPVSRTELLEVAASALAGAQPPPSSGRTIRAAAAHLRVLVAEDNPINQEVAASMLRKRGHHVEIAATGLEAIAAVREHGHFDVILMDLQMPELGGIEATQRIRSELGNKTPIIALTANMLQEERTRCLAAGMNGFISKPFKAKELFDAIESLGSSGPRPVDAGPASGNGAAVDLVEYRRALEDAGIAEIGDNVLQLFLEDAPNRLTVLRAAVVARDAGGFEAAAHAFKSACGNIRANRLAGLLDKAERAGRARKLDDFEIMADAIAAEYARVTDCLAAELASVGGARTL